MFDWIKFIGEFILGLFTGIGDMTNWLIDAYATITGAVIAAPDFLYQIMGLMLSVIVLMWVVNIF